MIGNIGIINDRYLYKTTTNATMTSNISKSSKTSKTSPRRIPIIAPTFKVAEQGKVGLSKCGRSILFPFYMMGCCGDPKAVTSTVAIPVPEVISHEFFTLIADLLTCKRMFDWDWVSFCRNILLPNKHHIKAVMKLDDFFLKRLLEDGCVLLNNYYDEDDCEGNEGDEGDYVPVNRHTFFTVKDLDY